jgi:hypothetical protein
MKITAGTASPGPTPQQAGDTAAALGLDWVGEGRGPDGAKKALTLKQEIIAWNI